MSHDFDYIPVDRETMDRVEKLPKWAQHLVGDMVRNTCELQERVAELSAKLDEAVFAQAEQARDDAEADSNEPGYDTSVFDKVQRRCNEYGDILNCRIAEDCEALNLRIASRALGTTLAPRHSEVREDRNGRRWIDFYPAVSAEESVV